MTQPNIPSSGQNAGPLNPTALTVEELAALLSRAGGTQVTVEMLQEDLEDGAPVTAEGRINLVHYAAWLNRDLSEINR